MSKSLVPERGVRKPAATPTPKLARGTRDISTATLTAARGTRDLAPFVPLETDEDTIVIDTDPGLAEELVLEAEVGDPDVSDGAESSEVTETQAASIDARMLDL